MKADIVNGYGWVLKGSRFDSGEDDTWCGDEHTTLEEALAEAEKAAQQPYWSGENTLWMCVFSFERCSYEERRLVGPGGVVYTHHHETFEGVELTSERELRASPERKLEQNRDSYEQWRRELATEHGMAFGVAGWNQFYGD